MTAATKPSNMRRQYGTIWDLKVCPLMPNHVVYGHSSKKSSNTQVAGISMYVRCFDAKSDPKRLAPMPLAPCAAISVAEGIGLKAWGAGLRAYGFGHGVQGLGHRVHGLGLKA